MTRQKLFILLLLSGLITFLQCTTPSIKKKNETAVTLSQNDKMQWWKDAKFGMFIHWGVYSVPAGVYHGHNVKGNGEWIMNIAKIPVKEYKEFARKFNPVKYNPDDWVSLAKEAGMKYMVITSKHHDGLALFDSKVSDWNVVDATPYKKDLLAPLVKACRKQDMHIGFYYSQCQDWVNPGGGAWRKLANEGWENPDSVRIDEFTKEHNGHWDPAQLGNYDNYLENTAAPQINEILSQYGKIDILWWDTPDKMTEERAAKFLPILKEHPDLITNDRLGGGVEGDLETPEQFIPSTGLPGKKWEVCMTMNDTWGFKTWDDNWKSGKELLLKLSDIVSKGGNFLLNVGPTSEGEIPQESVAKLQFIGKWMKVNDEAIYGTTASPFQWLPWGRATRKGNKIYLHVYNWPKNNVIKLPLKNNLTKAYLLSDITKDLSFTNKGDVTLIDVPSKAPDDIISVVVVEFEGDEPEVLPVPTTGKTGVASSTDSTANVANLFDGDPKDRWTTASEHKGWVAVDLGESVEIGHFAIVEPWHPIWDHKSQHIELQVKKDKTWKTVYQADTNGAGHETFFEKPVKGKEFRLLITGPKGEQPVLNEWILNRAL